MSETIHCRTCGLAIAFNTESNRWQHFDGQYNCPPGFNPTAAPEGDKP